MRHTFLLGTTEDNEIAFGEFEIRDRNGHREFSASFNTVKPFDGQDFDLEDYVDDSYSRGNLGDSAYLDLLETYDCSPSELTENVISDYGQDPREYLDCSVYPEWYSINNHDWYFETIGCGQQDLRNKMNLYTNEEAVKKLFELWDLYHLGPVSANTETEIENLVEQFSKIDEIAWITNFIKEHC